MGYNVQVFNMRCIVTVHRDGDTKCLDVTWTGTCTERHGCMVVELFGGRCAWLGHWYRRDGGGPLL